MESKLKCKNEYLYMTRTHDFNVKPPLNEPQVNKDCGIIMMYTVLWENKTSGFDLPSLVVVIIIKLITFAVQTKIIVEVRSVSTDNNDSPIYSKFVVQVSYLLSS